MPAVRYDAPPIVQLLIGEQFRSVIIDIRLPGKDGNEFVFQVKKAGCTASFLILTGSNDYQIPQDLIQVGISHDGKFLKPLADLEIRSIAPQKRLKAR